MEIRNEYMELFENYLNRWMAIVEAEIRRVVEDSQSNQVRPKLELVFTSVVNRQDIVKGKIDGIGELLFSEELHYQGEGFSSPGRDHKNDPYSTTSTFKQTNTANQFQSKP